MPKIRLLLVGDGEVLAIADEAVARQSGKTLDEMAEYGGALVEIEARSCPWKRQQQISALALKTSEEKGFQENAEALTLARIRVMIKEWPVALAAFVDEESHQYLEQTDPDKIVAGFSEFPSNLANAIHTALVAKMYPSVFENADFFKAWSDKQRSSEAQTSTAAV